MMVAMPNNDCALVPRTATKKRSGRVGNRGKEKDYHEQFGERKSAKTKQAIGEQWRKGICRRKRKRSRSQPVGQISMKERAEF
jgi:hypothetical protein